MCICHKWVNWEVEETKYVLIENIAQISCLANAIHIDSLWNIMYSHISELQKWPAWHSPSLLPNLPPWQQSLAFCSSLLWDYYGSTSHKKMKGKESRFVEKKTHLKLRNVSHEQLLTKQTKANTTVRVGSTDSPLSHDIVAFVCPSFCCILTNMSCPKLLTFGTTISLDRLNLIGRGF